MSPSQKQHRRPFNPFIARSRHTTTSLTYRDSRSTHPKRGGGGGGSRLCKVAFGGLCLCISYWLLGVGIWQTSIQPDDRVMEELSESSVIPTQRHDSAQEEEEEENERHYSFLRQPIQPTPAPTKTLSLTSAPTKQFTLTFKKPTLPLWSRAKDEATGDRHLPSTLSPNDIEERGGDVHTAETEKDGPSTLLQYSVIHSTNNSTTASNDKTTEMGELLDLTNATDATNTTSFVDRNENINKDTQGDSSGNTIVEASFVGRNETSDAEQESNPSTSMVIGEDVSENKESNNNQEKKGVKAHNLAVEEYSRTIIEAVSNTTNNTLHGNQFITEATTTASDPVILEQRLQSNRHELYKVSDDSKSNIIEVENNSSVMDRIVLDDPTTQARVKKENHFDDADRMDQLKKGDLTKTDGGNVRKEDESVPIIELVQIYANSTLKGDNHNDQVLQSVSQNE
ncbi:hypothetical protein FisN_27Lh078 [Fistulifera solaris]|uniref:Uncharacterized protein n=1 Tax=Fistulifera solaris TaxID=1519565 RepID=A0A1Z5JR45_FISSO|nr:hypothetical protein FisN_27Lh078 [Fistulifera solaris]|eukprot:GAX16366.1 hypothetical protein FisN_27Lh078 [Fistulifera solaris]